MAPANRPASTDAASQPTHETDSHCEQASLKPILGVRMPMAQALRIDSQCKQAVTRGQSKISDPALNG